MLRRAARQTGKQHGRWPQTHVSGPSQPDSVRGPLGWVGAEGAGVLALWKPGALGHLTTAGFAKNDECEMSLGQVGPVALPASLTSSERLLPTLARSPGLIRLSVSSERR